MRRTALLAAATSALVAVGCADARPPSDEGAGDGSIEVFGPWLGADADAFADSVEGFVERTGIEVRYTGSLDVVSDLRGRLDGALAPPDVAVIPQAGFVDDLAAQEAIVAFSDDVATAVRADFPDSTLEVDDAGELRAFPYRTVVKSLVWHRPDLFAQRGWSVPRSLDELTALVELVETSSDLAPWCFGVSSGDDTGWPATDWVEDLVVRRAGAEVYDEWRRGERGFSDPAIRSAHEEFADLVLSGGRSAGGATRVLGTELGSIPGPLLDDEPGCAMFKQASFATVWFDDDVEIGPDGDVDVFVLPGVDPDAPAPIIVGNDSVVQFVDADAVDRLVAYLASPEGAAAWARRGGYLSSRSSIDVDRYHQPEDRRLARLLAQRRTMRPDASDGFASSYRDEVLERTTAWIAGAIELDELVADLDGARPPETGGG
ncbi:ABC transporter substrate-binding protein [Ilumatobacter sp.]|uniref:ABC transporter substrate-binding protein n=1 Tax=Ilumatobacter sp. TaxID=1967498 RepID=UPI003B52A139